MAASKGVSPEMCDEIRRLARKSYSYRTIGHLVADGEPVGKDKVGYHVRGECECAAGSVYAFRN